MKPRYYLFLLTVVLAPSNDGASQTQARVIEAIRSDEQITIDARLLEKVWQREGASDFVQREPDENSPPTQKTDIWLAFDDEALYVAAILYDNPDSIITKVGRRDDDLASDWFYVAVDSYQDRRTGFFFGVTPSGSIEDGTIFNDSDVDDSWDGVWSVAQRITKHGWWVEMRIPYSQLRFPRKDTHIWGFNALRIIERRKEEDWFVSVPKSDKPRMSQCADIVGIVNIEPPSRIELLPYVASNAYYTQPEDGNPFSDGSTYNTSVGVDANIGLGSNLMLNATINPDFGQVEVDPAVVNLTQFETFYEEKRPFFVEGTNFLDFGRGGVNARWDLQWSDPSFYYSRRIGRPPTGSPQHEGYSSIPDRTTILAAAKITGKLTDQLSLGVLQSLTSKELADIDSSGVRYRDVVEPFASQTVVRTLHEFDEGRHGVGILGTALVRSLSEPYLVDQFNRRAFSFGADGWIALDGAKQWVLSMWGAGSHISGSTNRIADVQQSYTHYFQRPDAGHVHLDPTRTSLTGFAGRMMVNRQYGNWMFNAALGTLTPQFNSNDLGFVLQADVLNASAMSGYQWYPSEGAFLQAGFNFSYFRNYNYDRLKISEGILLYGNAAFRNYWGLRVNGGFWPSAIDVVSTRGGPYMITPNGYVVSIEGYSDSRKMVEWDFDISYGGAENNGYRLYLETGFNIKVGSRVRISFNPSFFRDVTKAQWVTSYIDPTATRTYGTRYIFGRIEQREFSGSMRLDLTFTPKLSLQLYMQPLVSVGKYDTFKELAQPRTFSFNVYGEGVSSISYSGGQYIVDPDGSGPSIFTFPDPNFDYKSLRSNMVLRWEYLPGSALYFVWTHGRVRTDDTATFQLTSDLNELLEAESENFLALKIAYWLSP